MSRNHPWRTIARLILRPWAAEDHEPIAKLVAIALSIALVGCSGLALELPTGSLSPEDAAVAEAQRSRATYGLPADREYVMLLLSDPQAVARGNASDLRFPVTAVELEQLEARAKADQELIDAVESYGRTVPNEWAGAYIDTSNREVAGLFTGRLAEHRAALERILHPRARYRLRQVRWSHSQLQAIADQIRAETAWFRSVGVIYEGSGVDTVANVATVDVRSADPHAATLIVTHFRADGRLRVTVNPIMPWQGGQGTLVVRVRRPDGTPAQDIECRLSPRLLVPWSEDVRVTGDVGRCVFQRVDAIPVDVTLYGPNGSLVGGPTQTTIVRDQTVLVALTVRIDSRPTRRLLLSQEQVSFRQYSHVTAQRLLYSTRAQSSGEYHPRG